MKRTQINKADLILCADFHLRDTAPSCRPNSFQEAQWQKVIEIKKLQEKHQCPVFHAGDLFDYWKPSPWLISKAIEHLPDKFYTIYGNHDLPQHNLDLADKTGIHVLMKAGKLTVLPGCHWEQEPTEPSFIVKGKKILVWHIMTYQGKKPWEGIEASKGITLLRKYPQYDVILTGHNHISFIEQYKDKWIVNPGSITRQTTTQINHEPKVFLYYADTNRVIPVILKYDKNAVISPLGTLQIKERDERIDAFINKLDDDGWGGTLNFSKNIESFFSKNDISKPVKTIIEKSLEI